MPETPKPLTSADRFHVMKNGVMQGPFTAQELSDAFDRKEYTVRDLVQRDGMPIWQPLGVLLPQEELKLHGPVAPDWKFFVHWGGRRLLSDVANGAAWLGWTLLVLGGLLFVLSHWPLALWVPFVAAAVLIAVVAMVRGKVAAGIALVAVAALGVGAGIYLLPRLPVLSGGAAGTDLFTAQPVAPATAAPEVSATVAPLPVATPLAVVVATLPPVPVVAKATPLPIAALPPVLAAAVTPAPLITNTGVVPPPSVPSLVAAASPAVVVGGTPKPEEPKPKSAEAAAVDFVQKYRNALLLVSDSHGSGSGFIGVMDGAPRLFTNNHVMADMTAPEIKRLNGTTVKLGAAESAVGHDIFRAALVYPEPVALEVMLNVEEQAHIDDEILVLGNSGGGGVVTKLTGKLVGIGPDRVEVNAEFIPGNSGSPIIHVATGKVIGIATYLTRRSEEWGSDPNSNNAPKIHRFGYRLDSVKQWDQVNWLGFQAEAAKLREVSTLTEDVFNFLGALRKGQRSEFATGTLRRPAQEWLTSLKSKMSDIDHLRATQSFLGSLRAMVHGDVIALDGRLRYDYFRRELKNEREVRDKLYKSFDSGIQDLSHPIQKAY